jgi:hypothetical protein
MNQESKEGKINNHISRFRRRFDESTLMGIKYGLQMM